MLGKAATTVDLLNIWFLSRETFNKVLLLFPHAASPIERPLIDLLPKCHPPASGGTTTRKLMMYQHVIWPQLYRGGGRLMIIFLSISILAAPNNILLYIDSNAKFLLGIYIIVLIKTAMQLEFFVSEKTCCCLLKIVSKFL